MNRAVVVLLWEAALGTSGMAVAGAVAPGAAESTADGVTRTVENGVVTVVGFGGDVRVGWATRASPHARGRARRAAGPERRGTANASGSLSSPALGDGSAGSIRAGLRSAGIDGPDSPLGIAVDEEDERASATFREHREPEPREASAAEVVASCAGQGSFRNR